MPAKVSSIKREHVEHFPAGLFDRVSAATMAKHYRSLQQLFGSSSTTARSPSVR